jgi:hypothetical protein
MIIFRKRSKTFLNFERRDAGVVERGGLAAKRSLREKPLFALRKLVRNNLKFWRDAGVVERGGLENRCSALRNPGFESLSLRKYISVTKDDIFLNDVIFI